MRRNLRRDTASRTYAVHRTRTNGQLRDGLTDIPIRVNDLFDRKAHSQQLAAVSACALAELLMVDHGARLGQTQRGTELAQEHGNPIGELRTDFSRRPPGIDSCFGASDYEVAVRDEEFVQHTGTVGRGRVNFNPTPQSPQWTTSNAIEA